MKKIILECNVCKNKFEKPINEYNRRLRLGKNEFFCSLSCYGKSPKNVEFLNKIRDTNNMFKPFKGGENKLLTEEEKIKSSMKDFLRRMRRRKKFLKEQNDIDIDKMFKMWEDQKGKCNYTGVDLVLPHNKNYKNTSYNYKASIDRINSKKPYTMDNIQFVSVSVNNLKNSMDDKELNDFFLIVKNNIKK